jgi:cyanophycin synthetase
MDPKSPTMSRHRDAGERVVYVRDDQIVLSHGTQDIAMLPLSSLKPAKASQPEMVMAAVAAAWALNIPPELIGAGLRTFESNPKKTPY